MGKVYVSPFDVVLSDTDVVQPDVIFVSNQPADIITADNIRGAPDLVVEILSPATAEHDRTLKLDLYAQHGVQEYWIVDPDAKTITVLVRGGKGLAAAGTFGEEQTLRSAYTVRLQHRAARAFLNCRVRRTLPCRTLPDAGPPLTFPQTLHPPIDRESTLARLLAAVLVCGGLDLGDDRGREMAEVGLQRTLTAIEDLHADEFLPPPAPTFSRAGAFGAFSRGAYGLLRRLRQ